MSDHYCASCRKDIESCHCPTTLHWKERVAAKRAREQREQQINRTPENGR